MKVQRSIKSHLGQKERRRFNQRNQVYNSVYSIRYGNPKNFNYDGSFTIFNHVFKIREKFEVANIQKETQKIKKDCFPRNYRFYAKWIRQDVFEQRTEQKQLLPLSRLYFAFLS